MQNSLRSSDFEFDVSKRKFDELTDLLLRSDIQEMKLSEVESIVGCEGRELQRSLLEEHIRSRGLGDVGDFLIGTDKVIRTHKRVATRKIKTIFGEITVSRMGYSKKGFRSLFPLDAQLNLPKESYSFSLQKHIVLEAIRGSFDEAIESIERTIGIRIPKRQAEKVILDVSIDFYPYYESKKLRRSKKRDEDDLLVLTMDGKGIPMRREGLRDATQKRASENPRRTTERLQPGEKKNSKRMAAVASVYKVERFSRSVQEVVDSLFKENFRYRNKRPKPSEKRVWASLERNFETTTQDLFDEAESRDKNHSLTWVALVDGDRKQIKYLERFAKARKINLTVICDFIHVLEYLWKASHVFFDDLQEKRIWVQERLERVLSGNSSSVAAGIRRSATRRKIAQKKREPVDKCASYLVNLAPYLKYNSYIKRGYPIATGVIEGACRHLIQDRMGRTGARWSLDGAEAVLKLRSLKVSREFEEYWQYFLEQEFSRNYESRLENIGDIIQKVEKASL